MRSAFGSDPVTRGSSAFATCLVRGAVAIEQQACLPGSGFGEARPRRVAMSSSCSWAFNQQACASSTGRSTGPASSQSMRATGTAFLATMFQGSDQHARASFLRACRRPALRPGAGCVEDRWPVLRRGADDAGAGQVRLGPRPIQPDIGRQIVRADLAVVWSRASVAHTTRVLSGGARPSRGQQQAQPVALMQQESRVVDRADSTCAESISSP